MDREPYSSSSAFSVTALIVPSMGTIPFAAAALSLTESSALVDGESGSKTATETKRERVLSISNSVYTVPYYCSVFI